MEELIPMVVSVALFGTIGYIVHLIVESRRRRETIKVFTEFYSRVLDKLGATGEFTQFMQSDGGREFMASLSLERTSAGPKDRILRAVQTGLVLGCLGLGFLLSAYTLVRDPEGREIIGILGVLCVSSGMGFLLSSRAAIRLSDKLGLLVESGASRLSTAR